MKRRNVTKDPDNRRHSGTILPLYTDHCMGFRARNISLGKMSITSDSDSDNDDDALQAKALEEEAVVRYLDNLNLRHSRHY